VVSVSSVRDKKDPFRGGNQTRVTFNKGKYTMSKEILVVGGGIAGIQSSLDLADMGFKVHMVEKLPSIGGKMAQLDKTFPTNDCAI
jgi:heterodisulfide reductase subunit A-like polyferredoxin